MASSTTANLTAEVKQWYDLKLLDRALPNLVHRP